MSRARATILVVAPSVSILGVGTGLGTSLPAFWVGYAVAIGVLVGAFFGLRREPHLLAASLLLWLSVERFAVAGIAPFLDESSLRASLAYKELFFPIVGLFAAPALLTRWRDSPRSVRIVDVLAILFGALVVVAFVASSAPLMDRIVYARRLSMLPLVYVVVRLLPWTPTTVRTMLAGVVLAGVLVAAFGIGERSILEQPVWRQAIPAAYYYHLSTLADLSAAGTDFPIDGLPVTFFDFTSGDAARRLVSTFLEATTLSSFLAVAFIVAIATYRPRALAIGAAAIIGVALVLTLGKAGVAVALVGLAYLVVITLLPRLRDPAWLASTAAGLIGALVVVSVAIETAGQPTGALAHFRGLQEGVTTAAAAPFGLGLGVGGNFGTGTTAAESTFGVVLVQLGFPGLILWSAWVLALVVACATVGSRVPGTRLAGFGAAIALVGFFATAAVTESAGGLLGNWVYAFVAGALITAGVASTRQATEEPLEVAPDSTSASRPHLASRNTAP